MVNEIGDKTFKNCNNLTNIEIPNNITKMGKSVFENCATNILWGNEPQVTTLNYLDGYKGTNITIPKSIKNIPAYKFYELTELEDIVVQNGIETIELGAFKKCSKLKNLTLPFVGNRSGVKETDKFQYPLGYLFGTNEDGGVETIQQYYGNSLTELTSTTYYIPSNLEKVTITNENILYGAFYNCKNLKEIIIKDCITNIGNNAFRNCTNLKTINISSGIENIGDNTFNGVHIINLTAPTNAIRFFDKDKLVKVSLNGGTTLPSSAFYNCNTLEEIYLNNELTSIGDFSFNNCSNLNKLTFINIENSNLQNIGSHAFENCEFLTSIILPTQLESIGNYAFENCYRLVELYNLSSLNITLSNSREYDKFGGIGKYLKVINTTLVDKPSKLSVYDNIIYYNNGNTEREIAIGPKNININSIIIDNNCLEINQYAFYNCSNLRQIELGNITKIGTHSFDGCRSLTSITLPTQLTTINMSAFLNCYGLVEIYNLSSLTIEAGETGNGYVGYYAISQDSIYTSIDTLSKLSTSNNIIYYIYTDSGINYKIAIMPTNWELQELVIDSDCTQINKNAFYNYTKLNNINLSNITEIGAYAFRYCGNLRSITISSSIIKIGMCAFQYGNLQEAIFENTNNWYAGATSISSSSLSNTSTAAQYLRSTYTTSTWQRS